MSTLPEPSRPDLDALAQRLSALQLAAPAVARDQLFFRTGQAQEAARRRRRFALIAPLLACVVLGGGVLMGRWSVPEPSVVEKLVVVYQPAPVVPKPIDGKQIDAQQTVPEETDKLSPPEIVSTEKQPGPAAIVMPGDVPQLRPSLQADLEAIFSNPHRATAVEFPPTNMSVEDVLGLPAGSLSEAEKTRWTKALNLRGES